MAQIKLDSDGNIHLNDKVITDYEIENLSDFLTAKRCKDIEVDTVWTI
jgi:hypothetical protein